MDHLQLLGKIAGVVIILLGLHMMGVLKIGLLYKEKRVQTNKKPAGFLERFSSVWPSPLAGHRASRPF